MIQISTANTPIFVSDNKVCIKGKFLFKGSQKLYIKGVTYGTFAPDKEGIQYPQAAVIEKDFAMMATQGINCVRVYTVPPVYLLDTALKNNLHVMVGLPWEQHITFLDDIKRQQDIIRRVQEGVSECGQHPAILCFAIGNEIPANIVRWHGKQKIEGFLKQLYLCVKAINPTSLVTYVNYPTTEYLNVDFLDFFCFNVYLETPEKLSAYIARLHNLSGDKPLVLAEIGLDSLRKGTALQAETLAWQIITSFAKGCAGMFIFAWTDEWWRGGFEIEDWDFGIVDRTRNAKPALKAVSKALQQAPFTGKEKLPFISVIVCSYNGAATIKDCMDGLMALDYPSYEVIVVNDGSTDNTALIAKNYPVKVISTTNAGLSSARNTGLYTAKGEIIAYIDDDAYPDAQWLRYLAYAYASSSHAGIGGPNLAPQEAGFIARCVAHSPGGPVHVLLSDETAEHIPGCNMSFRRDILLEIGGFDPIYRAAGDDVDVCWKIQKKGYTIGFHHTATVWHHRRNSIKAYWKQQKGYGKAEALLEAKWPEKYNGLGHLSWAGRLYGNGFTLPIKLKQEKIFHGTWGSALFQSVYQPADGFLSVVPLMPEWYLFTGFLALLATLGLLWPPLLWFWPVCMACLGIVIAQAAISAAKNITPYRSTGKYGTSLLLTTFFHVIQPMARLYGRIKQGLTPWRKRGAGVNSKFFSSLRSVVCTHWSEEWHSSESWLTDIEENLKSYKLSVSRGGDFDSWDLQISNTLFVKNRILLAIEEHGAGKQFLRVKCWNTITVNGLVVLIFFAALAISSAINQSWMVSVMVSACILLLLWQILRESANCMNSVATACEDLVKRSRLPAVENTGTVLELQKQLLEVETLEEELEFMEKKLQLFYKADILEIVEKNQSPGK